VSNIAVRANGIGKWYVVNESRHRNSLSEVLGNLIATPFRKNNKSAINNPAESPDAIWALQDVSFEIETGKVLGVIGRNGSGKSTLLKVLARITSPTTGSCILKGRVGALLEVGTGFHPDLSGRENIALSGTMIGMTPKAIKQHEEEVIDFSEVGKFIDTPVKHYSSGMFMRLAFAVAAHLEAEIMLIDEVLAVGDAGFQQKCKKKIQETALNGRTVVFTSHDMGSIKSICDSCLVLERGIAVHVGDIDQGISTYQNLVTDSTCI
jgi:lipopolysaccharide transport system ATP-binding protein